MFSGLLGLGEPPVVVERAVHAKIRRDGYSGVAPLVTMLHSAPPLLSVPAVRHGLSHPSSSMASSGSCGSTWGRDAVRVTYWIASGRRIILLTVFRKTRMRENREVERARRALARCQAEAHTVDEEG